MQLADWPEAQLASYLNCRGRLVSLEQPLVMGILNLTPDSFSDGGQYNRFDAALQRTETMLEQGADVIDIGGNSTRPGAPDIPPERELERIATITAAILERFPEALVSVDTFRASVAKAMLEQGVHMINDIAGGRFDEAMYATVARYQAPYIMMHIQGTPQTMQENPHYEDVVAEVYADLLAKIRAAQAEGITDLLIDPGFGFGKTLSHNLLLFRNLATFTDLGRPLVLGISRKSMFRKLLGLTGEATIVPANALHYQALCAGAKILRVHDVGPARQVVQLYQALEGNGAL
jgi:dihydropteroate synthase